MCTSFVVNKGKTLVGWNLDILNMIHRIQATDEGVYIEIYDEKEGTYKEHQISEYDYKKGDLLQLKLSLKTSETGEIEEAKDTSVVIAAVTKIGPLGTGTYAGEARLIVGQAYWDEIIEMEKQKHGYLYIDAEDADKMQDEIETVFGDYSDAIYMNNINLFLYNYYIVSNYIY